MTITALELVGYDPRTDLIDRSGSTVEDVDAELGDLTPVIVEPVIGYDPYTQLISTTDDDGETRYYLAAGIDTDVDTA